MLHYAYDPMASINENLPDLIAGHLGSKNICGIFHANTTDFHEMKSLQADPNKLCS